MNVSVWYCRQRERAKVLGFSTCSVLREQGVSLAKRPHRAPVTPVGHVAESFGRVVLDLHPIQCCKPSVKEIEQLRVQDKQV